MENVRFMGSKHFPNQKRVWFGGNCPFEDQKMNMGIAVSGESGPTDSIQQVPLTPSDAPIVVNESEVGLHYIGRDYARPFSD